MEKAYNKGHYPCSRHDYELYRENDFIGMLYLKDEEKPGFTFHLDEWNYDEEMKSTLEKEIQRYE